MKNLAELFNQFGSDKEENHHYAKHYTKYLPPTVEKFLEIGVLYGGGIRGFKEFYDSKGEFHGLNYRFGEDHAATLEQFAGWGIKTHAGSQSDIPFLNTIKDQFDVIVEDGSHHSDEQIITFKHLFINNIKSGGVYILEDLVCCNEEFWWRGQVDGFKNTMLGVLQTVLSGGEFTSQFFTEEENKLYKSIIDRIELCDNNIVFIFKK